MEEDGYYEMVKEDYDEMLEEEYEEFVPHYDGQIDFEAWRCLVDVHYRQKHGEFPVWDDDMYERLVDAAVDVGKGLIDKHDSMVADAQQEEQVNAQAQSLMRRIEQMLSFRTAIVFDNGFPFNRRFQRIEIWKLEKEDFTDQELEMGEGYNNALDRLVKDGLVRLVEHGGKSKYDVFQVVPV